MSRNLLIVGAGIGQVFLLKKAKALGHKVTVLTLPGDYPCIDMADDVIYCDVFDRDKAVAEAKARGIDAVVSDQNDLMNPTVAYIAEKLGLPGNSFAQVQCYCNKIAFRNNCDKLGIPAPRHVAVSDPDFDFATFDAPFPWIVKPADSQSSVGVKRVDSLEQLRPALKVAIEKSFTNEAIVEEFFVGKEIVCEGFIESGKFRLLAFADRKYFELGDLQIPSQTLFPSRVDPEILARVVECETKMAALVDPNFAIVHAEYLVNEATGEFRVVESALRGGGVYISSHLVPLATGIDVDDLLLKKALGEPVDVESAFAARKDRAAGYVCFLLGEGAVESVSGIEELKSLAFVNAAFLDDMAPGARIEKLAHKGSRKGPILVSAPNRDELDRYVELVQKSLKIIVRGPSGNASGAIWE
ncbi:MAG: ATP-grasp domain-containing protein [Thermoguttaceae bacterium]|nr:ATP-grasp domain-containing protein [Thermoguttaceae bacterium]